MPRRSRLSLRGIPWHIIQRGNNRSACFFAEDDYRFYLDRRVELSKKFGAAVHAYVLMTNHVHLLVTPERADSAALTMKHLGQRHAATNGNYALGNQRFQLDIERALGRRATKGKAGRPRTQAQHSREQLGLL